GQGSPSSCEKAIPSTWRLPDGECLGPVPGPARRSEPKPYLTVVPDQGSPVLEGAPAAAACSTELQGGDMAGVDRSLVADVPVFAGLAPGQIDQLLQEAQSVRYPKGTAVFQQDEE